MSLLFPTLAREPAPSKQMQECRSEAGRLWLSHWGAGGSAGLVWYVQWIQKSITSVFYMYLSKSYKVAHDDQDNGLLPAVVSIAEVNNFAVVLEWLWW